MCGKQGGEGRTENGLREKRGLVIREASIKRQKDSEVKYQKINKMEKKHR